VLSPGRIFCLRTGPVEPDREACPCIRPRSAKRPICDHETLTYARALYQFLIAQASPHLRKTHWRQSALIVAKLVESCSCIPRALSAPGDFPQSIPSPALPCLSAPSPLLRSRLSGNLRPKALPSGQGEKGSLDARWGCSRCRGCGVRYLRRGQRFVSERCGKCRVLRGW